MAWAAGSCDTSALYMVSVVPGTLFGRLLTLLASPLLWLLGSHQEASRSRGLKVFWTDTVTCLCI